MSNRLNQEREAKLQPTRIQHAVNELAKIGITPLDISETEIKFSWKGSDVRFYPFSGWASGLTIRDGRGLQSLLNQLK